METKITIEVPAESGALRDAADKLQSMADGLEGATPVTIAAPAAAPPVETAPPAAAPPAAAPPVEIVPPAASSDVDSEGLQWDKRIHSGGKSTIGDGTWKLLRGADKAFVEQVKGELRALAAVPPAATVPPAAAPEAPPAPPAAVPEVPAAPPAPPAEPVKQMTDAATGTYKEYIELKWTDELLIEHGLMVLVEPSAAAPAVDYSVITKRVEGRALTGLLEIGDMDKILAPYGVPDLPKLAAFPQHWAAVYNDMVELWG